MAKDKKGAMSMYRECTIHITVQYETMFTEVLPNNTESTELAIEGAVSPLLMELFGGEIIVESVIVEESQYNSQSDEPIYYA
jgi:hypothetical protein